MQKKHVTEDFSATDGDHQYDGLHDSFFEIIFDFFKSNMSFTDIIRTLADSNLYKIPISDFLHLLKCIRNNLVKYGVVIENKNSVSVSLELLKTFQMNKAISDLSANGKMKDSYPFEIFCADHILNAIGKNIWEFVFYALPFNLLINSIRNPNLSYALRNFNLELSFYFMIHYFYQMKNSVAPPATRILIIRFINTIVGLAVALERYDYLKTGHVGTHPLENFFGCLRIACMNDHSYFKIFRSIGKAVHVRFLFENMKIENPIRSRLGYGGTEAKIECVEGILPDITPFQMFKSLWHKIKFEYADSVLFESWFESYKTIQWSERISTESKISGSNILSRYLTISDDEGCESNQKKPKMKLRKIERIEKIKTLIRKSSITTKENDSLAIEEPFLFFIANNSSIDSHFNCENIPKKNLIDFCNSHLKAGRKKLNEKINEK